MSADTVARLAGLLDQAAAAHHRYEREELNGVYDTDWPAWYAAWLLRGGLGPLLGREVPAGELAALLQRSTEERQEQGSPLTWSAFTAERIAARWG